MIVTRLRTPSSCLVQDMAQSVLATYESVGYIRMYFLHTACRVVQGWRLALQPSQPLQSFHPLQFCCFLPDWQPLHSLHSIQSVAITLRWRGNRVFHCLLVSVLV